MMHWPFDFYSLVEVTIPFLLISSTWLQLRSFYNIGSGWLVGWFSRARNRRFDPQHGSQNYKSFLEGHHSRVLQP